MVFLFQVPWIRKQLSLIGWVVLNGWVQVSIKNLAIMYVTANNIPYEVYLTKNKEKFLYYEYDSHFEVFKDKMDIQHQNHHGEH